MPNNVTAEDRNTLLDLRAQGFDIAVRMWIRAVAYKPKRYPVWELGTFRYTRQLPSAISAGVKLQAVLAGQSI